MDWTIFWAALGVIVTILLPLGGLLLKTLQTLSMATEAIKGLDKTTTAVWARVDEHAQRLDENDKKIVRLETRMDYTERAAGVSR